MTTPDVVNRASFGSLVSRTTALWRHPMHRTGYMLAISSAASSTLGFAYWLIASRAYTPEMVGRSAAAISSMAFIAGLAQLNLMNAALRFVPVARRPLRLARRLLVVSTSLVTVVGTVYVLDVGNWTPELAQLVGASGDRIWFVLATVATAGLVMLSSTFVAVGKAGWSLLLNLAFVGLKLALVGIAAFVIPDRGIWYSWSLAVVVVAAVGLILFELLGARRLDIEGSEPARPEHSVRDIVRYLAPDYGGAVAWIACTTLAPVLVLEIAGVTQSAAFGVTWQIGLALFSVPAAIGQSFVAHGVTDLDQIDVQFRTSLRQTLLILVPVVTVLVVAAPLVLRVFGEWYAEHSAFALRWLALSTIPNAVLAMEVSRARVLRRMRQVVGSLAALAVLVIALILALSPTLGAEGAALAWLIAEVVVVGVSYLFRIVPRRLSRRPPSDFTVPSGWIIEGTPASRSDTAVIFARSPRGPAIIKLGISPTGRQQVVRETEVLRRLTGDDRLGGWRRMLPTVIEADGKSLIAARIPGAAPSQPRDARALDASSILAPLHRLDCVDATVDEELLERLIQRPAETVGRACRRRSDRHRLAVVAADLRRDLIGRQVRLGWSHGDFWPGNVLLDDTGTVIGVIDWAQAREADLLGIDLVHWLLTTADRPLPAEVVRRLRSHPLTPAEQQAVDTRQPERLPGRALLLLAWLRHVADNLNKSPRYATSPLWLDRTVRNVLKQATR